MQMAQSAILSTAYCPPIAYIAQLKRYPHIVIEQWEHYQKGSYRNRAHIATGNGLLQLSVPLVQGKHQRMPVREVRIDYFQPWVKMHLDSLRSAYNKSPFYVEYVDFLAPVYTRKPSFLFDLNLELLQRVLKWWRIDAQITLSTAYQSPETITGVDDYRNTISPKVGRQDNHLLGVIHPPYPQVFLERHGFLPDLSCLDLLFCMGPEGALYLNQCIGH